nr:hypothetical protein [Tanacetum cinerariifolium]
RGIAAGECAAGRRHSPIRHQRGRPGPRGAVAGVVALADPARRPRPAPCRSAAAAELAHDLRSRFVRGNP